MTGQTVGRLGTRYLGFRGELGEASEGGARLGTSARPGNFSLGVWRLRSIGLSRPS